MITIENLHKTYQKSAKSPPKKALDGINLQIKQGSFFGLLGQMELVNQPLSIF